MKWNTRAPTNEVWHRWFAWHPVSVGCMTGDVVWWEWVERKKTYMYDHTNTTWFYIHREIDQ